MNWLNRPAFCKLVQKVGAPVSWAKHVSGFTFQFWEKPQQQQQHGIKVKTLNFKTSFYLIFLKSLNICVDT